MSLHTVPIPPTLKSGESGQKHRSGDSPELPANDGIKVGAPDLETVSKAVLVTAAAAVVVVAVTLAPVAAVAIGAMAVGAALFAW